MRKRSAFWLLGAAIVLAGLGHYYLLFRPTYSWDAFVFYIVATSLLVRAGFHAGKVSERSWELVQAAMRRLKEALLEAFSGGLNRVYVTVFGLVNGLAALTAFLMPHSKGLLFTLPLWVGSTVAFVTLVFRTWRGKEPSISRIKESIARFVSTALVRYRIPIAVTGWVLLLTALVLLNVEHTPTLLRTLDGWLGPRLDSIHADLPVSTVVWVTVSLLSVLGIGLIGWTRTGVDRFPNTPLSIQRTSSPTKASDGLRRSRRLGLLAQMAWLGVVRASVISSTHWFVLPLWLTTLAVFAVCWWWRDRARGIAVFPSRMKRSTWLLIPILALGFGLALYRLADVPNSLWGDEGAFWTWARDLAQSGHSNPFDLGVYTSFPVMSSLYQSLWIKIFGPTLWSWRLSSVVIGTLTVAPLFFLTRKLLGDRIAWTSSLLMVTMPYFLAYARMGYNNIQPLLPVTLGLWLLVEAVDRHSHLLIYLSGVAFGMAALTYMSGHMGLVLAILVSGFLFVKWRSLRQLLIRLFPVLLVGWFFAAGPFVLGCLLGNKPCGAKVAESIIGNAFYGEARFSLKEITRRYPLWKVGQHQIFFEPRIYALLIVRGFVRTAFSLVQDGVARYHYLVGPLAGPLPGFFLAGFGWILGQARRLSAFLWMIWIVVCGILLSALNTFPPRAAHMVIFVPALAVVTAVGVWSLVDLLRRILGPTGADAMGVCLVVLIMILGLHSYFVVMPQRYMPNLENVMFWRAREMQAGSDIVFVVNEPYSADFRVWGIEQFDTGVEFHTIPIQETETIDFNTLCDSDCSIFFLPQDAGVMETRLDAQFEEGVVRKHLSSEGQVIGLEFVSR